MQLEEERAADIDSLKAFTAWSPEIHLIWLDCRQVAVPLIVRDTDKDFHLASIKITNNLIISDFFLYTF